MRCNDVSHCRIRYSIRGVGSKFKVGGSDSAPHTFFANPPVWGGGHSARRGGHIFAEDICKSITSMIILREVVYTSTERFRIQYVQMNSSAYSLFRLTSHN